MVLCVLHHIILNFVIWLPIALKFYILNIFYHSVYYPMHKQRNMLRDHHILVIYVINNPK